MLGQLVQLLKTRKGKYVLFLGAGASVSSGGKTTRMIVADVIEKFGLDSCDSWNSFCNFLKRKGVKERFDVCLKRLTEQSIIFVGYFGMDRDVLECLSHKGESVWWVNPLKVTADTSTVKRASEYMQNEDIYKVLINRKFHENFIWGKEGESDTFFKEIHERISVRDINSFCDQFGFGATRYRKMKDLF